MNTRKVIPQAMLCLLLLSACDESELFSSDDANPAEEEDPYTAVVLEPLEGSIASRAYDLNDAFQVVGESIDDQGLTRATMWTTAAGVATSTRYLGTVGIGSTALALNSHAQVVGRSNSADPASFNSSRPFACTEANGLRELSLPSTSCRGQAFDINDVGQVVGEAFCPGQVTSHIFGWTIDAAGHELDRTDFGTLGGTAAAAVAVNNTGTFVGHIDGPEGPPGRRGYVWTAAEGVTVIPGSGEALGLNDAGWIVGWTAGSADNKAFYWTSGNALVAIGTFGGPSSVALDINERNQIVGRSDASGIQYPFVWQEGIMIRLPNPGSGFGSGQAESINEAGAAVGWLLRSGINQPRAILWLPRGEV